jgi:WD40 repeat protein
VTAGRPPESYLSKPATGDPLIGEDKREEEDRVRRDFIRRGQPVFDMVVRLVASGDVGALELLYAGSTPLHELIADEDDFRKDEGFAAKAGAPFKPDEQAGAHAARALGGLGLALAAPEMAEKTLYSALAWYTEARGSVAAPGFGLRDIAKAEPRLLPLADLLSSVAGEDRWTAGALTIAVTLRALAAPGGKRARRSGITALMAGRSGDDEEGVRARLEMSVARGLPPGLVADPGRMALFAADPAFQESLDRAWAQAGAPRAGSTVLWSVGAAEGPVPYIEGESAGGAFAVVLDEVGRLSRPLAQARVIRRLKGGTAVIGRIDDLGYLHGVEGYDSKLNALGNHAKVIVPTVDLAKAKSAAKEEKDLEVVGAAHWRDAARSARHSNYKVLASQGLAVVLAAAIGVGLYAWRQHDQAVLQGHLAESRALAADSGTLVAQSQVTGATDPALARLEAVAAWKLDHTPAAGYAMLKAAALPPIAILSGDGTASVGFPAFSGDSRLLAAGSSGGDVNVWDMATHQLVGTLAGSGHASVGVMAFSADDSRVAAGTSTGVVVWDVSGRQLTSFKMKGAVEAVAFSRDGTLLAAFANKSSVQVWDVSTRRLSATFESSPSQYDGTTFSPNGAAFSPNGSLLAVGTQNGNGVQLWDLATGQLATTFKADADGPVSMVFSPDSRELATGAGSNGVDVWNLVDGKLITNLQPGQDDGAAPVAFTSDNTRLTIGINGTGGQVWNVASGQLIKSIAYSNTLVVSPDFSLAAEVTLDQTLELLNIAAESALDRPAATLPPADPDGVSSIAFSSNGRLFAAAGAQADISKGGDKGGINQGIRLWNVTTHALVATLKASNDAPVVSLAFTPDNGLLAAGTNRDGTQVWNVATRKLVTTLKSSDVVPVTSVAFSGGLLAAGTDGDGVQLWDVATGHLVATLHHSYFNVSSVAFSPGGDLLAVGTTGHGYDMGMGHVGGGTEIWNVATHRLVTTFKSSSGNQVSTVAVSRTGSLLAATADGIQMGNVSGGQPTSFGSGGYDWVALSQDGRAAAIPSTGGIQLWDTATGQQAGTLPDGNANTGDLPVAFSPDDTLLAVAASGGSVQLWKVPYLADTPGYLCSVAGEAFPPDVWAQYAPGIKYQKTCS